MQALDDACNAHSRSSSQPQTVWVGCSGGLDSVVLLDLVNHWAAHNGCRTGVIHVNHQLSANASDWQRHVEDLARHYGNQCISVSVDVIKGKRQSLEAQARAARYQAFASHLEQDAILLLAHHLDDQIETLLLRLFRGSGPQGLGAMQPLMHRTIGERCLHIVRPLLNVTRIELDVYARENGLAWVEDESNLDLSFDRNKVRHGLLPVIQQQWPERYSGIMSAMSRSSELCREQQSALELLLDDKLQHVLVEPIVLDCQALRQAPEKLHPLLVRHWLVKVGAQMPSHAVLQQLLLATKADQQAHSQVFWHTHQVRGYRQRLYFFKSPYVALTVEQLPQTRIVQGSSATGEPVIFILKCDVKNEQILHIEKETSTQQFELPNLACRYHLAKVDGQHYYASHSQQRARQLKHWFKEWQIPVWHRQSVIGVFANEQLLAVSDGRDCWHNYAAVNRI